MWLVPRRRRGWGCEDDIMESVMNGKTNFRRQSQDARPKSDDGILSELHFIAE